MNLPATIKTERPTLVWSPHPLMPAHERDLIYATFLEDESVGQYLQRVGLLQRMRGQPFVLTINGRRVPRSLWWRCYPKPGTQIGLHAVMHGGGDDDGGKNPLATIAMIVVVAIATYFFGPGGTAVTAGWSGTAAAIGYAATIVVGSLIVNQIFPPPKPPRRDPGDDSPTYAIGGGSNRMRRYEPFAKICGIHRIFPDFGAQPYTEPSGDDQIGFYVFDFGYNDVDLSEFKVGANSIENYEGVQIQISGADGKLTLFPGNVDTAAGATLDTNNWIERTTSPDTTSIAVDIGGSLFYQGRKGIEPFDVLIGIEYRAVGTGTWTALIYTSDTVPVVDTGSGLPTGTAYVPAGYLNAYVRYPAPAAGEIDIVSWSRRPMLRTFFWHVAKGQYEVRIRKLSPAPEGDPKVTSEIFWTQMRSYQPDPGDYTGRKRLALKIKASGQLNGVLDQFSAIARAKAQVWNGGAWVTQVTSNPAWWVLDVARGKTVNSKKVWGAAMPDSKIDIEGLKVFGSWCDAQGLTFNVVFDQQISVYEMLTAIAIMGRGTLTWATGKLGIVADKPDLPVVGVFGMHNILPDTFEIEYTTENLADVVEGEFVNPDLDWQTDFVRVVVPGATSQARVVRIPLFGRTSKALAGEDVNLYAAQNVHRNRRYKWQSDWEAMPVSRGDVVELSHDLASLDYSGRFIEGGTNQILKLPRKVPLYAAGSFVLIVRPDGEYSSFSVVAGSGDTDTLNLVSPLTGGTASYNPYGDANHPPYDFRWLYGATATPGKKLKVESFKPMNARVVELSCVDEVAAFYTSKTNLYEYVQPHPIFGGVPNLRSVTITEEGVRSGIGYVVRVTISWDVAGDYSFADVRVSLGASPQSAPPIAVATDIRGRSYEFIIQDGVQVTVQVTAYSSVGRHGKSSSLTATKTINFAASKIPANVSSFQIDGNVFRWTANEEADVKGYVIRFHYGNNTSWGDANAFHEGFLTGNAFEPPSIPPGIITFMIKAVDAADLESALPAVIIKDLGDSPIANVLSVTDFETQTQAFNLLDTYLQFQGTTGSPVSTPDSTANSIAGDIEIRLRAAADKWKPDSVQALLAKWKLTGDQRSYAVGLNTDGTPYFAYSTAGTAASSAQRNSTVAPSISDGQPLWLAWLVDVNDELGNHVVTFKYSTDYNPYDGTGTWTTLSTVTTAGVISLFNSTAALEIGARDDGMEQPYSGRMYYAEVLNGIAGAGTTAATFNPVRVDLEAVA